MPRISADILGPLCHGYKNCANSHGYLRISRVNATDIDSPVDIRGIDPGYPQISVALAQFLYNTACCSFFCVHVKQNGRWMSPQEQHWRVIGRRLPCTTPLSLLQTSGVTSGLIFRNIHPNSSQESISSSSASFSFVG